MTDESWMVFLVGVVTGHLMRTMYYAGERTWHWLAKRRRGRFDVEAVFRVGDMFSVPLAALERRVEKTGREIMVEWHLTQVKPWSGNPSGWRLATTPDEFGHTAVWWVNASGTVEWKNDIGSSALPPASDLWGLLSKSRVGWLEWGEDKP